MSVRGRPPTVRARLPFIAGAAAAVAALALALSASSAPGGASPASAEILPPNCGPTVGTAAASIRIRSAPPHTKDGDVLAYKVGAGYPAPANGIGCTVFDVDVFIKLPGATDFLFVCNIPTLVSGSDTVECPATSSYIVNAADRNPSGDLIAVVHVMGNKHDRVADCVFETSPRHPANISPCFDASAISRIAEENTPTPTPIPTATALPTDTPVPADTPPPAVAPTVVVDVLSEVRSGPGNGPATIGEIALPDTGSPDARPDSNAMWLLGGITLAAGGIALAGAGGLVRRRRRS